MKFEYPTRRQFLAASAASAATFTVPAHAAGDVVTLVVSYPAGGGADAMARLIAPKLAEALGQTVAEAGLSGLEVLEWNPILAPAGTSRAVQDKLSAAMGYAALASTLYHRWAKANCPPGNSPHWHLAC